MYKKIISMLMLAGMLTFANAKQIAASLNFAKFYSPTDGPYLEAYLAVDGNSVYFVKNENGKFQATITVGVVISDEAGVIKHIDKYNLLSPEIDDTTKLAFNFLDRQRIALDRGTYTYKLTIKDKNSPDAELESSSKVNVDYDKNIMSFSDVLLLENFEPTTETTGLSKNGYNMTPLMDNYYPKTMEKLSFYAELYNTATLLQSESFLLSYFIEDVELKTVVEGMSSFRKETPSEIKVVLATFDISKLQSGNYKVVLEARSKKNDLLAFKEMFFQRNNGKREVAEANYSDAQVSNTFVDGFNNKDSLVEKIACLRAISNASEIIWQDNQLKAADTDMMKRFLLGFWMRRNAQNPEVAYAAYMEQVAIVNKRYKNPPIKGYATDRGRVYLQYGAPDNFNFAEHENESYPYEIWHYYKIGNLTNRKFIFYNPTLVGNDYVLLHSDMRGEPNNPRWQMMLYRRNSQSLNLDNQDPGKGSNFGNNASEFFNRPK
ncbi:MAG: GWxTD domain-containing protein [Bacteroidetes bacterium]|nr:GWxTD domain-containing protein [Bacteroidota bacterium]